MVKQFDIITVDLDPSWGKEKKKYRPCIVVSNDLVNKHSAVSWIMPITSRKKLYPTDLEAKTKENRIHGVIDTVQIRSLDLSVRNTKVIDTLQDGIRKDILETIKAHTEII